MRSVFHFSDEIGSECIPSLLEKFHHCIARMAGTTTDDLSVLLILPILVHSDVKGGRCAAWNSCGRIAMLHSRKVRASWPHYDASLSIIRALHSLAPVWSHCDVAFQKSSRIIVVSSRLHIDNSRIAFALNHVPVLDSRNFRVPANPRQKPLIGLAAENREALAGGTNVALLIPHSESISRYSQSLRIDHRIGAHMKCSGASDENADATYAPRFMSCTQLAWIAPNQSTKLQGFHIAF